MKKFLSIILFTVFTVFLVTACSDDSKDDGATSDNGSNNTGNDSNTGGLTQPTLSNINSLQGTYDIEFFYVNAVVAALTTDCSKVKEYVGEEGKECTNINDSVSHYGQATIKVNEDGSVKVLSKIQINGGVFDTNSLIEMFAADKTYNFTEYPTIPANAITENQINDNSTNNQVTGTYGRSANKLVDDNRSKDNTFYFIVEADGTVVNKLVDVTVVPADTIVRMRKTSNDVIALDPNTQYPNPVINNFDTSENAKYTLKNN